MDGKGKEEEEGEGEGVEVGAEEAAVEQLLKGGPQSREFPTNEEFGYFRREDGIEPFKLL